MLRAGLVALCEEGVDRNVKMLNYPKMRQVALCEEGVDRNFFDSGIYATLSVALCEEGVDRNQLAAAKHIDYDTSPSAKRAWIEMATRSFALARIVSPSAKRAWIEISKMRPASTRNSRSPSAKRAWIEILAVFHDLS